jgi:hypothetical protein
VSVASFNDTVVTAVRNAGLDENGAPNIYAQEAAQWMGVSTDQVFSVQAKYRTEDGFNVDGLTAELKAMAPADVMTNVAQYADTMGQAKIEDQATHNFDPYGGFATALMGTALIVGAGAAAGAFSGASAIGEGAIDAVGGAGTGVGEAVGSNTGIIVGGEGTTSLIGGAAADTAAGSTPGLIDSLGTNLKAAFDPFSLMKKAAINTLSQAVMNDGKVDWSKVGVSTLLNAFGGAIGQTAGGAVGGGLIGSVTGGAVSGVTQAAILGGKNMLATAIASGAASGIGSVTQDWLKSNSKDIADKIFGGTSTVEQQTDISNAIKGGVRDLTSNIIAGNRDPKSILTNALIATGMGYEQRDVDALWSDMTKETKDALAKPVEAFSGGSGQPLVRGGAEQDQFGGVGFGDFVGPPVPSRFPDNALDQDPIPGPQPGGHQQPGEFQDSAGNSFATEQEAQDSSNRLADEAGQTTAPTNVPYQDAEHPYEGNGRWWTTEEDARTAREGVIVGGDGQGGLIGSPARDNALDQDPIPGPQPPPNNALDQDPIPVITTIPDNALDQDPIPPPPTAGTENTATPTGPNETGGGQVITPIIVPETVTPPPPQPPTPPTPPPDLSGGLSFSDIALGFNPIAGRTAEYWKTQRV